MTEHTPGSGFTKERQVLEAVLEEAGAYLISRQGAHGAVTRKIGTDIVTEVDVESEELIVRRLAEAFPDDGVFAEERGPAHGGASGRRWVIDPLDGTINFANGLPYFGVSIALEIDGAPVLGGIRHVPAGRSYIGGNGTPARTTTAGELHGSAADELCDLVIAAQLPDALWRSSDAPISVITRSRGYRITGSVALDLALSASGAFDLCVYRRTQNRWDWAAGEAIIGASHGCRIEVLGAIDGLELVAAGGSEAVRAFAEALRD